ncbi:hypothetical protein H4S02_005381, partial [Coemansia sp. RSA 2611]
PKNSVRARQQVFFAMRRQNSSATQATNSRVRQAELCADEAECQARIKRIRGSFDVFALEGKEECM